MLAIKTNSVFADAPEPSGMHWRNLCSLENQLASKLHPHPGAVLVIGNDAWQLREQEGELVLFHATYVDGKLTEEASRFDHELEWVDIEDDDLQGYNNLLIRAISDFDHFITTEN